MKKQEPKKKLTFKKVYKYYIPFRLHDYSPWQEQVAVEMERCKQRYSVRKSARWGFEITANDFANIIVYRS